LQIKNRRYEALQKLVDGSDYFSEEEMQRRNPILYNQLIGRYHTNAEREAFLFQCSKSSSALSSGPSCRPTPLTDMLIAHMNRRDGICSERRIDQEMQIQEEKQADREYATRTSKSDSVVSDFNGKEAPEMESDGEGDEAEIDAEDEIPEIDEAEKDLLKEEFFTTMYRHFLEGKDEDFVYADVDDNAEYDIGETLDQDEEEKYFDAEDADENHTNGEQNQPISNVNRIPVALLPNPISRPLQGAHVETEEDELDSYMREIELEVQRQNRFISLPKSRCD